jgi:RHS repeat-associated protein
VRSYHQHDALGNTIALINDSGVVTDTYAYWPYGELRTSTGTITNPFKFCGAWGYYTDTTGRTYVRARTLRPGLTRWMTVDPLWPADRPFSYGDCSPILSVDPSGAVALPPRTLVKGGGYNCCGVVGIAWKFNLRAKDKSGWLIQKVTSTYSGQMCSGKKLENPCPPVYFEAWKVDVNGQIGYPDPKGWVSNPYPYDDTWFFTAKQREKVVAGPSTHGDRSVKGELMFWPGALPPGTTAGKDKFMRYNPDVPCAGALPTAISFPKWKSEGAPGSLEAKWACCRTSANPPANKNCRDANNAGPCIYPVVKVSPGPKLNDGCKAIPVGGTE